MLRANAALSSFSFQYLTVKSGSIRKSPSRQWVQIPNTAIIGHLNERATTGTQRSPNFRERCEGIGRLKCCRTLYEYT